MSLLTRCVRSHAKITRSSNYSMKSKVANWSIQPQSRVMKMSNVFDDLAHVFFGSSPPLLIAAITAHAQRGEVLICIIKYRKPPSAIRPVQDGQSKDAASSHPAIYRVGRQFHVHRETFSASRTESADYLAAVGVVTVKRSLICINI